ncbi:hypothetical protein JTB14_019507 [Gonioctena quinquepunctata]|nr:hypothetical protein JTB14_019507 [Gonioctena quinquepunctata]
MKKRLHPLLGSSLPKKSDAHEKFVRDRSDESRVCQPQAKKNLCDFDITVTEFLDPSTAAQIISRSHRKSPNEYSRDKKTWLTFYVSLLKRVLPKGETVERDWLFWTREKSNRDHVLEIILLWIFF